MVEVKIHTAKMTRISIRNLQSEKSAFALIHLLSHLKGYSFGWVMLGGSARLNPAFFNCFHDDPLDIRCMLLTLLDVPDEAMKCTVKKIIRPKKLRVCAEGPELGQHLSFAVEAKKWCPELSIYVHDPSAVDIDASIKV